MEDSRQYVRCTAFLIVAAVMAAMPAAPLCAATLTSLGHAAGAQCAAADVNDSGTVVGGCKPGNDNGSTVAWVSISGVEVPLTPLAAGMACAAGAVTNGGRVIGSCLDTAGVAFGVAWNSGTPGVAPLKLSPLPGLLGLGADVSTSPRGYTQSGFVVGQSVGANGTSTVVLWPSTGGAPVLVSARGDNCAAVDVADSTGGGNPTVLLNCPSGSGTVTPRIAQPTGLLGTYVTIALTKYSASSYCVAAAINSSLQVLGTCMFSSAPFSKAAFWTNPGVSASVLTLPDFAGDTVGKRNAGLFLNDLGHVVYSFQTADGRRNAGYSNPAANLFLTIPPLHAGATVAATGFGNNDLVTVAGDNANEITQAAVFNPASPAVSIPVPLFGGGASSMLTSVSTSGAFAAGTAEDSGHAANAVMTSLP